MTGIAVLIMLLAIVIIWGGLAVSITALISRGRRAAGGCAEPSAAGAVEARFFSSTGLSDGPSRSCSRPCRASMRPVLLGAASD